MRLLALTLLFPTLALAQTPGPLASGDVLTVEVEPGQTLLVEVHDPALDPSAGEEGPRLTAVSPAADTLHRSYNDDTTRAYLRVHGAAPGRWTVTVEHWDERAALEGYAVATATPPARTQHEAAAEGDLDALRPSLAAGLEDWGNRYHETPLMLAAAGGHAEAVRLLIDAGADVHATAGSLDDPNFTWLMSAQTALHYAAQAGSVEAVRLLLDAGADPNAAGVDGSTPLHSAVFAASPAVVRLLLDAGAAPDMADDLHGTPSELAWNQVSSGGTPEAEREALDEILGLLGGR